MNSNKIAIIGAGQSGLHLGIGLLTNGYKVTLLNNRSASDIEKGKVTSSQCMFDMALAHERALKINFWDNTCPPVNGIGLNVPHPEIKGEKVISWVGNLEAPAQAVDQRVKFPRWINEFEKLGGTFKIEDADINCLEQLAIENDLVILAGGKGEIVKMFERDEEKSMFAAPQRALALTYAKGMTPNINMPRVSFNLIPGIGEYFVFPALTTSGDCEIMVFEGVPGGPMDCWKDIKTPQEHLNKSLEILNTFLPWEAERCKNVSLTDDNGILSGMVTPTIRKPVLTLPSGKKILGIADAVVVNDPITGQGSNNAAKCTQIYLDAIIAHGNKDFTQDFMQQTFDKYWSYAANVTLWTNTLLGPPPPHILNLLGATGQIPSLANKIANGFSNPQDFFPWWLNPDLTQNLIKEHASIA